MSYFDAYGELARNDSLAPTHQAGRLASQVLAERLILRDVLQKLAPEPTSRLLEIGCGPGNLLIPLSFTVERSVGVDHPSVIQACRARYSAANVTWVGGQFPAVDLETSFDRILVYSVLHCLRDFEAVISFVSAAMAVLEPGGTLLFGDLPNTDRKARFLSSDRGREFHATWRQSGQTIVQASSIDDAFKVFEGLEAIGTFTDRQLTQIFSLVRDSGCDSYLVPQPPTLPFGNTRVDLIVVRP